MTTLPTARVPRRQRPRKTCILTYQTPRLVIEHIAIWVPHTHADDMGAVVGFVEEIGVAFSEYMLVSEMLKYEDGTLTNLYFKHSIPNHLQKGVFVSVLMSAQKFGLLVNGQIPVLPQRDYSDLFDEMNNSQDQIELHSWNKANLIAFFRTLKPTSRGGA
jgi:hypothetical protein